MRRSQVFPWNLLFAALVGFGLLALDPSQGPRAQTVAFQNSNTACEGEVVLCDSSNPSPCSESEGIACKNVQAAADFNGDGFPDCAAGTSNFPNSGQNFDVSVLMNSGNTGPCVGGSVDQFAPSADYALIFGNPKGTPTQTDIGSIVVGDLGGGFFDDLAVPASPEFSPQSADLVSAFSVAGGGFGPAGTTAASTSTAQWNLGGVISSASDQGQRNAALLDCDGDGDLDAAVAGGNLNNRKYEIDILRNDGTGLQDIVGGDVFDTMIPFANSSPSPVLSVAVADFDNRQGDDLVVAVHDDSVTPDQDLVSVCLNNGSCGYTCSQAVDLNAPFPGQNGVNSRSIAAGDFDGDGQADFVVPEPGLDNTAGNERGLHYYLGNGNGTFATPGIHVPYNQPLGGFPFVVTTGYFNNDNILDVAVNYLVLGRKVVESGNVGVVTSDGAGGFDVATLSYGPNQVIDQSGIDAANFDQQGCDDIIAVATEIINLPTAILSQREAFVFLNQTVAMSAVAGADQSAALNTATAISGASCTLNPADPGAELSVGWTVTPAAGATLTGVDTLTPSLTATVPGDYTLTLTCNTRCTGDVTDTKVVTVAGVPPPSGTQGGCLANLTPNGGNDVKWSYALLMMLPLVFGLRRLSPKGLASLALVAGLLGLAVPAKALTTSFSVNTFEPTVDDSEYFTVYGSPTMLQRNFHVGFYLDYAHNPYEFGNANFNRVSGIVDHLLTGNIAGSYAAFDWMTVGLLIPIHFWEGIRTTPPVGNENNFDIGDIQLVLKFRLLTGRSTTWAFRWCRSRAFRPRRGRAIFGERELRGRGEGGDRRPDQRPGEHRAERGLSGERPGV
ncbi:MAG: hypothetical protein U1F66_12505 [bacterium]